jgi:hypothetical protein
VPLCSKKKTDSSQGFGDGNHLVLAKHLYMRNSSDNLKRMILILYIICCILAAWYTQKPWILLYSVIPLGYLFYSSCCAQESSCQPEPSMDVDVAPPCHEPLEQKMSEWKSLGGPYYLHVDAHLVHLLYNVTPCSLRTRLVHLCNLMLRMVEEKDQNDINEQQRRQMKDWWIELVNDSDTSCEGIRQAMYRHIAYYLL